MVFAYFLSWRLSPFPNSSRSGLCPVEMLPRAPCCPWGESQVVHILTNGWVPNQAPEPCLAKPGPPHLCDQVPPLDEGCNLP